MYCLNCNNPLSDIQIRRKFKFCCKGCATSFRQSLNDPDIFLLEPQILFYLLGLIWTDGNLSKDNKKVTISNNDENLINTLKPLFCDEKRKIYKQKTNNFSILNTNKKTIEKLLDYGLHPSKSYSITYPDKIPKDFNSSFIRGIFDGDGCVYISSIHKEKVYLNVSITSASIPFLEKLQTILKELDIDSNINKDSRKSSNSYYLKIQKQESVKNFYRYIYAEKSSIHIEYKRNIFLNNNIV